MASHYVCSKSQLAAYISVFKKVQPNWELLLKWYVLLMHDHACKIHSWVLEQSNLDPLIPQISMAHLFWTRLLGGNTNLEGVAYFPMARGKHWAMYVCFIYDK